MTELEASVGEHPPPYMIFVVVFLFFLTGLLGFLICHLLKKKGYRCRTGDMDDEDEEEEKLEGNADDADEENQDTVEQILKCIIENEANMEAFNEMIGNHNVCVRHDSRLRKESIGGVPPHLHTVHSGTDHNSCHLCAQVRSKKGRRQSRTPRSKQRPGEQTVFSVGRFRVTHTDKKLHGGPNPLVSSGDQLDQSQDSEERKEGGYNLRSMFKDVRRPSEGSNGVAPSVGKRRKSLTLFGLRRGSDPVGIKGGEGPCREAGGVRLTTQQQPVVLEEVLQAESPEVDPERGSRPGVKPGPEKPDPPQRQVQISSVNSPSSQSEDLTQGPGSATEDGSKHGPGPEPGTNRTAASSNSSLPVPSPATSGQTFKPTEKQGHVEAYDPGPLQTSTPISSMPASIPSFTPTGPPEPCSGAGFPVTQSSSPDLESGFAGSPVLISSGSSPPSRKASPEAANRTKLPSGHATSSQSPLPSSSFGNSASPSQPPQTSSSSPRPPVMSGTSMSRGDMISSSSATKEQQLEGSRTLKTEVKRVGILKTAKPPPDPEGPAVYPPTDQPSKDELSSLPPSSSSLLSPSSPGGSRAGRVTIISPDSKRQFSVATMVEEEQSSTVIKDQKEATSELRGEPEQAAGQGGEVSAAEVRPRVRSQEKDDMVEMEDIKDCKVTEEEGGI